MPKMLNLHLIFTDLQKLYRLSEPIKHLNTNSFQAMYQSTENMSKSTQDLM